MNAHWLKKVGQYAATGEAYATLPGKTPAEVAGTYAYAQHAQQPAC